MKVMDANIILKWFLKEEDSNKAIRLKTEIVSGRLSVALPDLILYEIANALRYKQGYTSKLVGEATDAILELNMDIIVPTESLIKQALDIAYEKGISFYDASYIALAELIGYQFTTADTKLYERVKDMKFVEVL